MTASFAWAADENAASDQVLPGSSVSIGLTIEQVIGELGQPRQEVDLGSKKIYTYPSVKLIFVNGKVAEIRNPADNSFIATAESAAPEKRSGDLFPYEIGVGFIVVAICAFLLGRWTSPAARARRSTQHPEEAAFPQHLAQRPPPRQPPTHPSAYEAPPLAVQAPLPPVSHFHPIERLRHLEALLGLGILTPEEFEQERRNVHHVP